MLQLDIVAANCFPTVYPISIPLSLLSLYHYPSLPPNPCFHRPPSFSRLPHSFIHSLPFLPHPPPSLSLTSFPLSLLSFPFPILIFHLPFSHFIYPSRKTFLLPNLKSFVSCPRSSTTNVTLLQKFLSPPS